MMIQRDIEKQINTYLETPPTKTLLVIGLRQVGKTTTIRHCIRQHDIPYVELSFKNDPDLRTIFTDCQDAGELLLRFSLHVGSRLSDKGSLIFFDDIEEYPEALTGIRALTRLIRGDYYCIIAGTPRGLSIGSGKEDWSEELKLTTMLPLSFREFCMVNGITERVCSHLENAFLQGTNIDTYIHQKMLKLFHKYLVVGGMPEAVSQYLEDEDYSRIYQIHQRIISLMKEDLKVLDPKDKRYMQKIFSLLPEELSKHNKRFIMKNLGPNFKYSRQKESFRTMSQSGLVYASYCVDEPLYPQAEHRSDNLFKLYMPDVGLLTALYDHDTQDKLLNGETIQNGAICENAIAQELIHRGRHLYYYSSHQYGEIDFLIAYQDQLVPMLIKSGKNYQRHNGMHSLMHTTEYHFNGGVVLGNDNISVHDRKLHLPIYMIGFIKDPTAITL